MYCSKSTHTEIVLIRTLQKYENMMTICNHILSNVTENPVLDKNWNTNVCGKRKTEACHAAATTP